MSFKIIDMPLPSRSSGFTKDAKSEFARMLLALQPGQAYVHELDPGLAKAAVAKAHSRLSARLQGITRIYGVRFATRRVDGGIGVWKVEKVSA